MQRQCQCNLAKIKQIKAKTYYGMALLNDVNFQDASSACFILSGEK